MAERTSAQTGGTSGHIETEALAALVDGRLSPSECARLRAHLAGCEECYDTYVEVLHLQQEELGAQQEERAPLPFAERRTRKTGPWFRLAAAAVILCLGGVLGYDALHRPDPAVAILVDSFEDQSNLGDQCRAWDTFLGEPPRPGGGSPVAAGTGTQAARTRDSFQLGVLLLDLALQPSPEVSSRRMARILGGEERIFEEERIFLLRASDGKASPAEIRQRLPELETSFDRAYDEVFLDLGKWTEAARIAAATGAGSFFTRRINRDFPSWVLKESGGELPPQAARDLTTVARILEKESLVAADLEGIEKGLSDVTDTFDWR